MEQVHGYDCKADLWSLGITALELVKGYAPYAKYPPMKVLILTIQEDPPSLASYDVENGGDDEDEDNRNDNLGGTFASTISGFSDAVPTGHDRSMFEALVALCLQKNPLLRPTCSELLASRYFAEYSANPELRALRQAAMRDDICSLVDDVGGEPTAIAMTASTQTASDALSSPLLCTDETTAWRNSPLRNTSGGLVPSTFYDGAPESSSASKSIAWSQSEERPAGTTWVFADGSSSQVLLSSENTGVDGSMDSQEEVDTVLEELDEFERRTGGEHYERNALTEVPTDLPEVGRNLSAAEQPRPSSITPTVIPLAVERLIDDNGRTARNEELPDNDAGGGALDDLDQFMDEFEQTTVGENFRRNSPTEH